SEGSGAPTEADGEAGRQAQEAIASGCDAVFVCGGDGTIHDVLQGMIGTAASLAIIPLGTANTLAHDLRIPWNPAAAARVALAARPRCGAVGLRNFGGILQVLAAGASLGRDDLRVVVFRTSNRVLYVAYVLRGLLRKRWRVAGIELLNCEKVSCRGLPASAAGDEKRLNPRVYVEADGELVGTIPAEITVVPGGVNLLAP